MRSADLPRLQDMLAKPDGELAVRVCVRQGASGRAGRDGDRTRGAAAGVSALHQGFALPVSGGSEVEFADDELVGEPGEGREVFRAEAGRVSLRELAEEELLLALPIAAACSDPQRCPRAPRSEAGALDSADAPDDEESDDVRRPFLALRELLKKT